MWQNVQTLLWYVLYIDQSPHSKTNVANAWDLCKPLVYKECKECKTIETIQKMLFPTENEISVIAS